MHLSCITADRRNTHQLSSNWMALPSPPESISLQLTSYGGHLAVFAIAKDRQVLCYQFDQSHREWIKCCELGTVSTALPYQPSIRVSTSALSVAVIWDTMNDQIDGMRRRRNQRPILRIRTGRALQPDEETGPSLTIRFWLNTIVNAHIECKCKVTLELLHSLCMQENVLETVIVIIHMYI